VDQELLSRRQHLAAENRMPKASLNRALDLVKLAIDEAVAADHAVVRSLCNVASGRAGFRAILLLALRLARFDGLDSSRVKICVARLK
jgi:hypothetical protein